MVVVTMSCSLTVACVGDTQAQEKPVGVPQTVTSARPVPEHPLDARGLEACGILSQEQLALLGMSPSTATDRSTDLAGDCRWRTVDGASGLAVVVSAGSSIERVYSALEQVGGGAKFEIRGYPAVREGAEDASICTIYVGIAEDQIASVEVGTRSTDFSVRACDIARRGIDAVLDSLVARS